MNSTPSKQIYVFDTSALMEWQARYYPTDIFASLLAKVDGLIAEHRLLAPKLVEEELGAVGTAELEAWAKARPAVFASLA